MKARTEWHFGGGAAYCESCGTTCPECPYQVNSPRTEEGWQALAVLDVCSSQVRAVQGAVLGMDFNAWMSASQALDADPTAMTHLFPAVEAGLTQALNKPSSDNPHG